MVDEELARHLDRVVRWRLHNRRCLIRAIRLAGPFFPGCRGPHLCRFELGDAQHLDELVEEALDGVGAHDSHERVLHALLGGPLELLPVEEARVCELHADLIPDVHHTELLALLVAHVHRQDPDVLWVDVACHRAQLHWVFDISARARENHRGYEVLHNPIMKPLRSAAS